MKHTFWLLLACICSTHTIANETQSASPQSSAIRTQTNLKQLISGAIDRFEQTNRQHWSYQVSRYENEEGDINRSIEAFDANQEQGKQWSLLSLNDTRPSEKQKQTFAKQKLAQAKGEAGHYVSVKLRELVQLDSLELESENQAFLQANFRVALGRLGDKASQKLRGTLWFNKHQQFIESVEITNAAPFSPMFSAKITDFKLTFRFYNIDGAILPHQQTLNMTGRFALFTEIDEASADTFSDYRYLGK